jgi:hypothetical protein
MAATGTDGVVVAVEQQPGTKSHMDWGAVIAGAVMAAAVSFVLLTFGSALGLTLISPQEGADPPGTGFVILIALWTVIVTVASFTIGGYVAGRMRRRAFDASPHEVTVRDTVHGLTVWALSVLIGGILAATVAAGVVRTGVQVAGTAVGATAAATGAAASDDKTSAYFADMLFRAPATPTASAPAGQPAPGPDEQALGEPPAEPMAASRPISEEARQEAGRILVTGAAREDGLSEGDKQQLAALVARETGVPQDEARNRVETVLKQFDQTVSAAEAKARDVADAARKASILAAFLTVTSLLVAGAAAAAGAGLGGKHRDEGIGLAGFFA